MLETLYSTGMQRAELCQLKVEDVDSHRMFPGTVNNWRADKPITAKNACAACVEAAKRAGITKRVRTLDADGFLRRFLQHLLPRRFVRIGSFGPKTAKARSIARAMTRCTAVSRSQFPAPSSPSASPKKPAAITVLNRTNICLSTTSGLTADAVGHP